MDSFISGIKENKKLIIITLIVIIIVIVIALYNNLKPKPQYDPEVNEYNEVNYIKKNYKNQNTELYNHISNERHADYHTYQQRHFLQSYRQAKI